MYLALDLATEAGWAAWDAAWPAPAFGTLLLRSGAEELGFPMEKLRRFLNFMHAKTSLRGLFVEAPINPRPKMKDGRMMLQTSMQTIKKLNAYAAMAEWWAYKLELPYRLVEQQDWRKHFLGKGSGRGIDWKQLSKDRCKELGWSTKNDNEADAAGQLDYGLACFGVHVPWRDALMFGGALK
jgi:hypothetical protein